MKVEHLQQLMDEITNWSDSQFGTGDRTLGIINHLKEEVDELHESATLVYKNLITNLDFLMGRDYVDKTVEEFADCFMLLLDAAAHFGLNADKLVQATLLKLEVNKNRKWGEIEDNGVVHHIKK